MSVDNAASHVIQEVMHGLEGHGGVCAANCKCCNQSAECSDDDEVKQIHDDTRPMTDHPGVKPSDRVLSSDIDSIPI